MFLQLKCVRLLLLVCLNERCRQFSVTSWRLDECCANYLVAEALGCKMMPSVASSAACSLFSLHSWVMPKVVHVQSFWHIQTLDLKQEHFLIFIPSYKNKACSRQSRIQQTILTAQSCCKLPDSIWWTPSVHKIGREFLGFDHLHNRRSSLIYQNVTWE